MFVATLDMQKVFYVANYELPLRKWYLDGITGNDWLLVRDTYSYMTTSVKWESHLLVPFVIRHCFRHGGPLLTTHYRRYNNPHLIVLEDRYIGMMIGSICALRKRLQMTQRWFSSSED